MAPLVKIRSQSSLSALTYEGIIWVASVTGIRVTSWVSCRGLHSPRGDNVCGSKVCHNGHFMGFMLRTAQPPQRARMEFAEIMIPRWNCDAWRESSTLSPTPAGVLDPVSWPLTRSLQPGQMCRSSKVHYSMQFQPLIFFFLIIRVKFSAPHL